MAMNVRVTPLMGAWAVFGLSVAGVIAWLATSPVEREQVEYVVELPWAQKAVPAEDAPPSDDPDGGEPAVVNVAAPPPESAVDGEPDTDAVAPEQAAPAPRRVAMIPAPHPDLVEEGPDGPLPVVAEDGRASWQVYGRPFEDSDDRPRIAVVISDLGMSTAISHQVIDLPAETTLAFMPYAQGLEEWFALSRSAGHEVLIQVPMEPETFPADDPGPRALMTALQPEENVRRLEWVLAQSAGYVGVMDQMGSGFVSSEAQLEPVLATLRDRGLLYLDNHARYSEVPREIASRVGLPRIAADVELDGTVSKDHIRAQLDQLETLAGERGYAVAIGRPYPVTIDLLRTWIPSIQDRGFAFVPITAIHARQAG